MFLSSADGDVGELLELPQGCQGPFKAQKGRWDSSRDASAENGLLLRCGEHLLVFLELRQQLWVPLKVGHGPQGPGHASLRNVQSPCEMREASQDSSAVAAKDEVLILN